MVDAPHFIRCVFLHLELEEILLDLIASEERQTWIFNQNTSYNIVLDHIFVYKRRCLLRCHDPCSVVLFDVVRNNLALRINQDNAVIVALNLVIFDYEITFTINNEDPFLFWVFNVIELDLRFAWGFATQSDVCFQVAIQFVGDDLGTTAFRNQNALVVILHDHVGVREGLYVDVLVLLA